MKGLIIFFLNMKWGPLSQKKRYLYPYVWPIAKGQTKGEEKLMFITTNFYLFIYELSRK